MKENPRLLLLFNNEQFCCCCFSIHILVQSKLLFHNGIVNLKKTGINGMKVCCNVGIPICTTRPDKHGRVYLAPCKK